MTTLGAMITDIATELGRSDLSAVNGPIDSKIREAIAELQPNLYYFNEDDTQTFSTVAGQVEYDNDDVPDAPDWEDWYSLTNIFLEESSGQRHELLPMSYSELKLLTDTTDGRSRPTHYCRKNDRLYLYPNPDAAYTVRLAGHYKVEAPAASGTANNPWMVKGYYSVKYLAKSKLYAHHIKNIDMAKVSLIEHQRQDDILRKVTTDKKATGVIQATTF